jgi:hypothetical protein
VVVVLKTYRVCVTTLYVVHWILPVLPSVDKVVPSTVLSVLSNIREVLCSGCLVVIFGRNVFG